MIREPINFTFVPIPDEPGKWYMDLNVTESQAYRFGLPYAGTYRTHLILEDNTCTRRTDHDLRSST